MNNEEFEFHVDRSISGRAQRDVVANVDGGGFAQLLGRNIFLTKKGGTGLRKAKSLELVR